MDDILKDEDLNDKSRFKDMTKWFSPVVLIKSGLQAIVTSMFAQYADGRLTQAALDDVSDDELSKRYDLRTELKPGADGAIWIDYVADLGDGFNSTYAVALLLGRKDLRIDGVKQLLPRGQLLIMGGDQVYPFPNRDEYKNRMRNPYKYAFPDSSSPDADHPKVFLIPGNHDWYDGLKLFQGMFCTGKPVKVGSWRTAQHRSYFSIRLTEDWWLWGFDSGVDDADVDVPQARYFKLAASQMPEKPNIILCASVPIWLKANDAAGKEELGRGADYIANIAKNARPHAQIHATISGDTHHYNRYSAPQVPTQFITSGGGGAFLHPTHNLPENISMAWVGRRIELSLKTGPGPAFENSSTEACYPSRPVSRTLVLGNNTFFITNASFCLVIGTLYWFLALIAKSTAGLNWHGFSFTNPPFILALGALFAVLRQYADPKRIDLKNRLAAIHTAGHALVLFVLMAVLPGINKFLAPDYFAFWLFAVEVVLGGAILGGLVWGFYLIFASWVYGVHHNDAFSAMGRSDYRNFLRMRIKGDELTIYPIGMDSVPQRDGWKINASAAQNNQNQPTILSRGELQPKLIEGPIIIRRKEFTSGSRKEAEHAVA